MPMPASLAPGGVVLGSGPRQTGLFRKRKRRFLMFSKTVHPGTPRPIVFALLAVALTPVLTPAQTPPPVNVPKEQTPATPAPPQQTPPVVVPKPANSPKEEPSKKEEPGKKEEPAKAAPTNPEKSQPPKDESAKPTEKAAKEPADKPAAPTDPALPVVIVSVRRFRDAGGEIDRYKGPDGRPLTERLSDALVRALSDTAAGRFVVAGSVGAEDASKTAIRLIIEGDLSAPDSEAVPDGQQTAMAMVSIATNLAPVPTHPAPISTTLPAGGDNATGSRPYLLVTRVWRDGKPRRLVAQFAGVAGSVRGLTGNLLGESDANLSGVVGGMAERIGKAAVALRTGTVPNGAESVLPAVGFAPAVNTNPDNPAPTRATPSGRINRAREFVRPKKEKEPER